MKRNQPQDIWKRIDIRGANECWEWKGPVTRSGYAQFAIGGALYSAHRVAYEQAFPGAIPLVGPKDKAAWGILMHSCDNRKCCNPGHLSPGTQLQNVADAIAKGRNSDTAGVRNGRALVDQDTADVMRAWKAAGISRAMIAAAAGMSVGGADAIYYSSTRWRQ